MKTLKEFKDACWKGYKAIGMKEKNGRKVPNCVPEEVELDEDKAQYRYTGGMHGEYHPTKKQPSRAAHKDAAKFHERESKTYSKALGEKGADKDYVNRAIDFHTNAASHHRNMASSMKEEVELDEQTKPASNAKNYTRKGGNGPHSKWTVTLKNGKTKTVHAANRAGIKDRLSPEHLIIGIKSSVKHQNEEVELDEANPQGMSDREYARHELGKGKKPEVKVGAKVTVDGGGSGVVQKIYDKELSNGQKRKFIHLKDHKGRDFHHRYYAHRVRVMEEVEVNEMDYGGDRGPGRDGNADSSYDPSKKQIHLGSKHLVKPSDVTNSASEILTKHLASKKKVTKEEVEQIDEISKKTLGSYIKQAAGGMKGLGVSAHQVGSTDNPTHKEKMWKRALKREKGISMAADKLTKEEVTLEEMSKLSDALAKIKHDFENPPADHKDAKPAPAKKPEPKKGGGMDYYPDSHGGRRYMGDSVEMDGEMISEGPFTGIGKMMMKRKLKKQVRAHNVEKMKHVAKAILRKNVVFRDKTDPRDGFAKEHDEARRKQRAINRLNKEEVEQIDEGNDPLVSSWNKSLVKRIQGSKHPEHVKTNLLAKAKKSKSASDAELVHQELDNMHEESEGENKPLGKVMRAGDGKKKFKVYVKNAKGNTVKVGFGDPNMEIKRDDPERRKNFRARHNCASATDRTTPKYWSCRQWRSSAKVEA